jgi:phosphoglycerate dehydrogenase-like enzyme
MRILIATPLEAELVARIAGVDLCNDVMFDAALLPPPRFPSDHRGAPNFVRDSDAETRFNAMLERADVLFGIPGDSGPTLTTSLARAPHVRWVQCCWAGSGEQVRAAELPRSTLERVAFTSAAGLHAGMLAEFVFLGLLALRKDLRKLERLRERRAWDHFPNGELAGSTLAVVGVGHIGAAVARAAHGFGMNVIGVTRDGAPRVGLDEVFSIARLTEAFARADAAVVTLPATDATRGLVDARALAALRPEAIFCNVGRGSVVDQAALVAALRAGALAGAVLDVFEPEPLPTDNPLWTMENVIFAPHTMALSWRENERLVDLFIENLRRFARGDALLNRIDTDEFY